MRYNKGYSGRGQEFFDAEQLERLERLMQYYPSLTDWIDPLMGREARGGELEARASLKAISPPLTLRPGLPT